MIFVGFFRREKRSNKGWYNIRAGRVENHRWVLAYRVQFFVSFYVPCLIQSTLGNHPWLLKPQYFAFTHNFHHCQHRQRDIMYVTYIHERHIPLESSIFCGLTSKWTIYFECINSNAWANCRVKFFDSSSVKVFRSPTQYSKISPPIALKNYFRMSDFFYLTLQCFNGDGNSGIMTIRLFNLIPLWSSLFKTKRYPTQRRGYKNKKIMPLFLDKLGVY